MQNIKEVATFLRIPYSFFLMPVFLFAISQCKTVNTTNTLLIFIILHLFIYPASNGYSFYIESTLNQTKKLLHANTLFYVTIFLDTTGIILALFVNNAFAIGVVIFILFSRVYNYIGVKINLFGWISFITSSIFQGGFIYILVYVFAQKNINSLNINSVNVLLPAIICTLNIAGNYPINQIYLGKKYVGSGTKYLSNFLGLKGTFYFSAVIFGTSTLLTMYYFKIINQNYVSLILLLYLFPAITFFIWWYTKILKDIRQASYTNTMFMNGISSTFTNLFFITIILIETYL